ncbi:920_t:CDS:2, partial [Dentiscutata heterogama]
KSLKTEPENAKAFEWNMINVEGRRLLMKSGFNQRSDECLGRMVGQIEESMDKGDENDKSDCVHVIAVRRFKTIENDIQTLKGGDRMMKGQTDQNKLCEGRSLKKDEQTSKEEHELEFLDNVEKFCQNLIKTKEQSELLNPVLINEVSKTFAFSLSELEHTDLVKYEVRTEDSEILPMKLRPIRIDNPKRARLFEEHLKQMMKYRLLEEGKGPNAYHCFLVDKKEGRTDRIRAVGYMKPTHQHIIK